MSKAATGKKNPAKCKIAQDLSVLLWQHGNKERKKLYFFWKSDSF